MTAPYYSDERVTVIHADCLDALAAMPAASVHAIVTDPPYGLGFMGKAWDDLPPGEAWARECLRVLRPGGHLLAFGGSRTWHRLACAVEDAGFEMRDSIAWLYSQGFPKSMNPGRDQRFCQGCEVESDHADGTQTATEHGLSGVPLGDVSQAAGSPRGARSVLLPSVPQQGAPAAGRAEPAHDVRGGQPSLEGRGNLQAAEGQLRGGALHEVPGGPAVHGEVGRLRDGAPAGDGSSDRATAAEVGSGEPHQPRPTGQPTGEPGAVPEQRGSQAGRGGQVCAGCGKPPAPVGLGTALKPAFEPVVVARKPLTGTVAANVLAHGTGALNIDACRTNPGEVVPGGGGNLPSGGIMGRPNRGKPSTQGHTSGRWPANVVLDEHSAAELDRQSGTLTSGTLAAHHKRAPKSAGILGAYGSAEGERGFGDQGGASRFFYTAKATSAERPRVAGVAHPTVKPLDLMRWLVRLVTPPGGTVLDPFAGSGTTLEAAIVEGFRCVGIEREADYLPLILHRIERAQVPLDLDGGAA